jgi:hypothetical protein
LICFIIDDSMIAGMGAPIPAIKVYALVGQAVKFVRRSVHVGGGRGTEDPQKTNHLVLYR